MSTVELTQYMRPHGRRETVRCDVPDEIATLAEDMALSCEVLMSGQVVIYARFNDEEDEAEDMEFAANSPSAPREQHPDKRLIALIERVSKRRERGTTGGEG
jgi:hypothetical protein